MYFSFVLIRKKRYQKKGSRRIFSPTLFLRFAKGARTRCAQTIAPLDATLRAIAWRRKNKAEGGKGAYGRWEGCLGVVRRVLRGYEMPPYHILLFGVTYNIRGGCILLFSLCKDEWEGDYWPGIFFLCGELAIPIRTVVNRSLFRRRRCLRGRYRRKDILPHSRTR